MTMTDMDEDLGEIRRTGETVEIVFRRRYARPLEKVWAAVSIPERISDWFGQTAIEGDRIRIRFSEVDYEIDGRIVAFEPMKTVAWTWPKKDGGESVVRFDLEPDGDGCRLTLTETGLVAKDGAGNAAGWHAHLGGFAAACDGIATPWARVIEREQAVSAVYKARSPA